MKKRKFKKKIKKKIRLYKQEIEESMDDINVQTRNTPLTVEQVLKISDGIKWYKTKIANLKLILNCL